MRALLVTVLYGLAATGCASSMVHPTSYPAEWPERSGHTDCRITGAYQDIGELRAISGISPGQSHAHLSWLLREGRPGSFDDSANPELYLWLEPESAKMRVGPERSAATEQLRSEDGVVCESDGALTLRFEADAGTAYRHTAITAWNGADGSLIVRMGLSFTEKGLPMLPSHKEIFWFRFQRIGP